MKKPVFIATVFLLIASLSCNFVSGAANPGSGGKANGTKILFQDDFSSTNSGWDKIRDADGVTDYENEAYRIQINTIGENQNGMSYWASPGLASKMPADLKIEVDATKAGGPDDNDFGIICRYRTDENDIASFYQFMATSDGYAGIVLVNAGDQNVISAEKLSQSDAIKQGAATNHLRAECVGDNLTFFVNGQQVVSATDATLTGGDVGLIAGTYSQPGTDIMFDNFVVSTP